MQEEGPHVPSSFPHPGQAVHSRDTAWRSGAEAHSPWVVFGYGPAAVNQFIAWREGKEDFQKFILCLSVVHLGM